ncbi:hypothetical protein [Niabella hirudinis]|uniref:hypothetical protein n=1 Tax=Niabella hirudinis TaxID=1285929 RepID=UPI003EB89CE1
MVLAEKLKKARKLLGETQAVAGTNSGVAQRDISYLEAGKKKYLPTEYILYLQKKGFDLNTVFDETKELATIEKNDGEEVRVLKKKIEEQEEFIRLQKDAIALRERKLNDLETRLIVSGKAKMV